MPLTQAQTSLPLSDSDLLLVKTWVFDIALGFLLLGVQVTLSIVVLWVFVCCLEGLGVISTKIGCESYIVNLPIGFFCIFDQIQWAHPWIWHFLPREYQKTPSFNGNMAETIILTVPLIFYEFYCYNIDWIQSTIGDLVLGLRQDSHSTANSAYHTIISGLVAIYPIIIILAVAHENNKSESVNDVSLSQSIRFASVQTSKSEDHHPESGRESQLAFPVASINNNAEVEGNEIDIVPRLS
ncbi:hypothetical protein K435DRAFT_806034 [Dendrothele bispora CBS 962.96]|uniref:Uncharacterized protein n=1 Tax=Dendrothele bispora (strain CBS 962.96) TaxID=1314807 RepID=A0A4S8L956_DENBC|nr:hypothetical protein K435DRAFT_806034 [Dendrothele bispora CBS 962.96]